MNAEAWVTARARGVPEALSLRVRHALLPPDAAGSTVSDALLDAAVATLSLALSAPEMTRANAIDVLTADALATYAFEAAAESGGLPDCADRALRRIARIGDGP